MTLFYQCDYPVRITYMIFLIITIMTLMFLLWRLINSRRGIKSIEVCIVVMVLTISVYALLLDDHIVPLDALNWQGPQVPFPILPLWIVTGLLFLGSAYFILLDRAREKKNVTESNIKEALDEVPIGICCFRPDGTIALSNRRMQDISEMLGGRIFMSYVELQEILVRAGDGREKSDIYRLSDGSVHRYAEENLVTSDGEHFLVANFFDVTELAHRKTELEAQNEELRKMSVELQIYKENVRLLAKEEEILLIKARWHDVMGEGLTAIRRAFFSGQLQEVTDRALKKWSDAVTTIQIDNDNPDQMRDELGDLKRDAMGLQIHLVLNGALPADKESAKLFILAVRNCLLNAAQHANATALYVDMRQTEQADILCVTNNGTVSGDEIVPRGGLINVRNHAERIGGSMEIRSVPDFEMKVVVPRKE